MIDVADTIARGGRGRVDLLRYCVMSIAMEPLFLFLAGEYRLRPTHAGALALFDVFCDPHSPARLSAHELLPPRELALAAGIAQIRSRWAALQAPRPAEDDQAPRSVPAGPGRSLFDALVRGVLADANGRIKALSASYDPHLSPAENLPGGRMNASQRSFVDNVWIPFARPRLAAAGFWQIATVG
ncbi:MAG TPA: hypothetical protein VHP37_21215 [Burkholderiales bacterium]|nr:hypothetical protein [Burkholderiales bacterium]